MDAFGSGGYQACVQAYQGEARYLELLRGPYRYPEAVALVRRRMATRLLTTVIHHDGLTAAQERALSEFRLHQMVLCGWYDPHRAASGEQCDPALARTSPDSLHGFVGTDDGLVLAYFCFEAPRLPAAERDGHCQTLAGMEELPGLEFDEGTPSLAGTITRDVTIDDSDRPSFATEEELCGPRFFRSLPGLRSLPLRRIRELTYILRNQVVASPLASLAIIEAFRTAIQLTADPQRHVDALIGNIDLAARHILARMGVPMLYAPHAPFAPLVRPPYWVPEVDEPGRFWPFAAASADFRRHAPFLARLDETLSLAASPARRALVRLLRESIATAPRAFAPQAGSIAPSDGSAGEHLWTADPYFGLTNSPLPKLPREPVVAATSGRGRASGDVSEVG